VLYASGTVNRIQAHFFLVPIDCPKAPERIIHPVAVKNGCNGKRFVVSTSLSKILE
jgi:hypothetical protein